MGTPSKDVKAVALLHRVGQALHRLEREQVCCGEVTRHQFATLRLLETTGGLSTSEVANRLGIHLSTASRNLDLLARAGCIRRRPSADDARAVHNVVVSRGRACMTALCGDENVALAAVLARLPSRERRPVKRALALLVEALDAGADADAPCCTTGCATPATMPTVMTSPWRAPRRARSAAARRARVS